MPVMRPPLTDWCCDTHKAQPVDVIRNDSSLLLLQLHRGFCRGDFIFANPPKSALKSSKYEAGARLLYHAMRQGLGGLYEEKVW